MNPLRRAAAVLGEFYRRPLAWMGVLVTSAVLTYGGGAVMFWFHAIFRGEHGPAIADVHHWLLDSSLGFVALTPVVALIVPLGVWAASAVEPRRRVALRGYVVSVAVLFTLTTGPGPFLHNQVAGADTPVARMATSLFGHDMGVEARNMHVHDRSALAEGFLQIVVGLPVYLIATWLALGIVRRLAGRSSSSRPMPIPRKEPAVTHDNVLTAVTKTTTKGGK